VAFEPVSIAIEVGDTTKPVVGIDERMNGPRVWSSDQIRLLQWSAQDANEVIQTSLDVSTTNGQNWERLSESMDTETEWTPLLEASSRVATRFRASATDRMLNTEIIETAIPLWLATPEQAVSAYSGWQLTGTPHSEVTRNAMPAEGVYRFDWNGQSYSLSDGFTALNGHWVGALATSVDTVSGTYSETGTSVTVAAGWSILTTPVFASVSLDSVVVIQSETEHLFDEAVAEGLISGFYSFVDGAYELVTEMEPFKAYWIGAQEEVTFMFPIHDSVPVTKTNVEDPDLQLIVSSYESQQRVIMNVGASADIPAPPPAPSGYKIGLKGLETVLGDLYLIKHLEAGARVEIPLQIQGPKRQVMISWPDQDVVGMTAVLVVGQSRYNLMSSNSVTFTTDESQVYVEAGPINTSTEPLDGPSRTALTSIYPNPFNPTTRIQWEMAIAGQVQIEVYDMLGRRVVELVNDNRPAGIHSIELNARNLSSGIYQVRMLSDGQVNTRSITLIK
jgi:hypothetical protein